MVQMDPGDKPQGDMNEEVPYSAALCRGTGIPA